MRKLRVLCAVAALMVSSLALASAAYGAPTTRQVQVLDACDPASFNAALMDPTACVRGGGLSFDAFIGQLLAKGEAPAWRFSPEQLKVAEGGTIEFTNRGGEFHTFTEVAEFGGGCVDQLNALLGLDPVAECATPSLFGTTGVAPGQTNETPALGSGTHLFECLIHPWMRSTVTVQ